ncbi:MAG TPA: mechanosensitive ion channel domain-containing protein [Opitutaceae bacterium]
MDSSLVDLPALTHRIITGLPAAAAIAGGAIVLRVALTRGLALLADRTSLRHESVMPFSKAMSALITVAAIVLMLGVFGFNLGGLWAMLATVLGMIAIGFVAVWSVLSNMLCTVILLIFRPFAIGDEVEFAAEPVRGQVVNLNFVFTTLRTEDGALLQIPNNLFFQKVIKRRPGSGTISLAQQLGRVQPADA